MPVIFELATVHPKREERSAAARHRGDGQARQPSLLHDLARRTLRQYVLGTAAESAQSGCAEDAYIGLDSPARAAHGGRGCRAGKRGSRGRGGEA